MRGMCPMLRTETLILSHRFVVLSIQLGPFREVVLRRRVCQLALQANDILLQGLRFLRRARGRRRKLVVKNP